MKYLHVVKKLKRQAIGLSSLGSLRDLMQVNWRRVGVASVVGLLVVATVVSMLWGQPTNAATMTFDGRALLEGEVNYSTISQDRNGVFQLQTGDLGEWAGHDGMQNLPSRNTYYDTDMVYGPNNSLYLMGYSAECHFIHYDITRGKWRDLPVPPISCAAGTGIAYNGANTIYFLPGGNSSAFFKFDVVTETWSRLPDAPSSINNRGDMTYVPSGQGKLYAFRGGTSAVLLSFDVATQVWSQHAPFPANSSVQYGMSLAWDGLGSIYAITGNWGEFGRYSILNDEWEKYSNLSNTGSRFNTLMRINNDIYNVQLRWCCSGSNGEQIYVRKYSPASQEWTDVSSPVSGFNADNPAALAFDSNDTMYILSGENPKIIYKYTVSTQSWNNDNLIAGTGNSTNYHGQPIFDNNNYVYYSGGSGQNTFDGLYRLDLTTHETTQIGTYPAFAEQRVGMQGVYFNNALYIATYNNYHTFARFNLDTNSWTELPNLPVRAYYGMDMVDGGDGFIYVTFGGGSRSFYRYNDSSGWQSLTQTPIGPNHTGNAMTRIGGSLYGLAANNDARIMRYDIATGSWVVLDTYLPNGSIEYGSLLIGDKSRYLYVVPSNRLEAPSRFFYRYDTQTGEWKRMSDLPGPVNVMAGGFYDENTDRVYLAPSIGLPYLWHWTPTSNAYVTEGEWHSKTLDLTQVSSWQSLVVQSSGTGTVEVYTRTSTHGNVWSSWALASGTTVNSTPQRYLQIKIVLKGNGTSTPTVTGLDLQYTQEASAPSLPSQLTVRGNKDGPSLTSGQTYEYQHPYFRWQGATDGANGSGVKGYHVYFGTDSDADPLTEGNFQESNEYTVTSAMSSGSVNYLRLRVEDNLGNVSDAATYFSYRYWYISPPASIVKDSQVDFSQGTNSLVDLTSAPGSMKLRHQPGGSWSTGPVNMLPESSYGGASVIVGDYLYVLRGLNTGTFWRYHLVNQIWEELTSTPQPVYYGSSLIWDGNRYLYALRGNSNLDFYRYDLQNATWTEMPQLPVAARPGSDMEMLKNNQIAMLFPTTTDFYVFDIDSLSFSNKAPLPEIIDASHAGSGMWFDGDDTVYTYLGGYYLQHNQYRDNMAAYTISTDSWRSLARPSVNSHYMENNLASDGNGGLYVFGNDWFWGRNRQDMATRYDIATDTWSRVEGYDVPGERGTVTSDGQRYIYIIPSTTTTTNRLIRYDTWTQKMSPHGHQTGSYKILAWDQQDGNHWATGAAASATYDGVDTLYMIGDEESNESKFIAYSYSKGTTEYLPPPPFIGVAGSMTFSDNYVYYLPARNNNAFWRYDISKQNWQKQADFPQSTVYRPGATTLVADKDGYIYAVRGNATQYYRFNPDSGQGSWTALASYPGGGTTYYGSASYDGDDYIYYLRSNGSSAFYRYSISGNSWTSLANLPQTTSYGISTVIRQGKIYATAGVSTNKVYIYDIAGNSWTEGTPAPFQFDWGNMMVKIDDDKAIVLGSRYNADLWQYNFPDSNRGYGGLATHISLPFEIEGLFDYATIKAEVDIPEGTSVELWTRTSADNLVWEDWRISKEVKHYDGQMSAHVTSTPQRFTQVKVILQSYDNVYTPTVESFAVDYYFDVDPPTNPSIMTPYTNSDKSTELQNNTWYNHAKPLLDWPEVGEAGGATDGELGSNLRGYWVYFGTDETALPQTAGQFVEGTEFEANLTQSGIYYFRLQAQDMTGNVDPNVFAPFIYKFDNTPPNNPTFITVTPSGFTANNNFTFQWPNASDAHSGIDVYCYRTGATSGAFSTETCTKDLILEDVPAAYLSGTNVFYIRTRDIAGNYAASSAQVSFYYSTDPPGPVQNLRAIPPVSEQNLFAFTWDLPATFSGDPDRLMYCFSINELPSNINTTCTPDRFLSAFKAATQQGTNIVYMVAKDEANNVNWNNYASANFIANTVSPGIPLNLTVTDSSDRTTDRWSLTSTWNKPTFEGNGIDHYIIERSENNHTFEEIGTVSTPAFVDMMVTPEKVYYYRVRASDNVGNAGGPSGIVSQRAQGSFASPPDIVSNPRANVSFDRADIRWVTSRESTSFVYYGTQPNDLQQSKGSLDLVSDHSVTLTGLAPSTVYYYRVQSFDNDRSYSLDESYSQIYTFRTTETARVVGVRSSDITLSSAIIEWQTSVPTKTKVEYGTSTDYGFQQEGPEGHSTNHLLRLSGLQSGTTYHYRVVATTEYGSVIQSDDYTFTTIPLPRVSNVRFQPLLDRPTISVAVIWTTNVPTDSSVSYSTLGTTNEVSNTEMTTEHRIELEDLAGSAEYLINIRGRDQFGNLANADNQRWTSQVDTRSPSISEVFVDVASMGAWGNTKAQMIISWQTDEPSSSQVEYQLANGGEKIITTLDPEPKTNHVVVISNLELAHIYRIKPVSTDISGNTTYGQEVTAVTPDSQSSLLDIIIRTLQALLGQQ